MSLLRWLAATKSISGVRDKPSPYRMLQPNLLPKFGSNPARGRTRAQEDKSKERKVEAAATNVPEPAKDENEQEKKDLAVAELVHAKAIETQERAWMFWRKWARSKRTKLVPVQTELGLDMVQVVRNDLSDSDLEVVTKPVKAKKATERSDAAERLAGTLAPPGEPERLGEDTEPYRGESAKLKANLKFGI